MSRLDSEGFELASVVGFAVTAVEIGLAWLCL
jgi:hypothetical protein